MEGIVLTHVDDLLMFGSKEFRKWFISLLEKDYQVGSTSENEAIFCGQRMRFQGDDLILVDQDVAIEEIAEIAIPAHMGLQAPCEGALHTEYRKSAWTVELDSVEDTVPDWIQVLCVRVRGC